MKTISFLAIILLMISCNSSSKQNSLPQLKETVENDSIASTPLTTNDNIGKEVLKDSISPAKEAIKVIEDKPSEKVKVLSEVKKEKTTAINKQVIPEQKPKIIDQKEVQEEKNTEKETVVEKIKQAPVRPNHDIWNTLTKTYVSKNGKVNYGGLKGAIPTIEGYLLHLQNTPPTGEWSKKEILAYWFNLYNAATVHLVASNYPVKSIKDIDGGKPWDKKIIKSGTKTYSLNDIENKVVRPNYNEPRLHVAFNCAAVSCPSLLNEAFTPAKLNSQLNTLSKQWVNDVSKNKITENAVEISQIFNWYGVDFKQGIIPFINTHSQYIKVNPEAKITYMEYNWKLNE